MIEEYTFDEHVEDIVIFEESNNVFAQLEDIKYFIETCFEHDYFRESSTTGLHLDEIEDILVDAEEIIKVYKSLKHTQKTVELYLEEAESRYQIGDLVFALPKLGSVREMVEDIASVIVKKAKNSLQYLVPIGAVFEVRNGVYAFWSET